MRFFLTALLLSSLVLWSCTDDTASLGIDVMPEGDNVTALSAVYTATSTTVENDAVLATTNTCHLGCIVDPDMNVRTTCNFLAQFHVPDLFSLPKLDRIVKDDEGNPVADSCDIRIYFDEYFGDSLATMKLYVQDLSFDNILDENEQYYTNLDPSQFLDNSAKVQKTLSYAVKDLTRPSDETDGSTYYRSVVIKLPASYGQYLMQKYYDSPESFSNSYHFIHEVCPGFYFKSAGGVGSMITSSLMALDVYFRYHTQNEAGNDTIVDGMQRMGATEEVIQCTSIENDYPGSLTVDDLNNEPGSYVKTPAGLLTEMTLPVSEIVDGENLDGEHYNDSINQVQIVLRRYQNKTDNAYALPTPSNLLLVRKDKMKSFFENNELTDSKESYLASYDSDDNLYRFTNIAQLITILKIERDEKAGVTAGMDAATRRQLYAQWEAENPDWNKIYLVPVKADYTSSSGSTGSSSQTLTRIQNDLGLTSAKLEGGKDTPLEVTVIYGRFSR